MVIEQTIETPANRRFTIDLPPESHIGRAELHFPNRKPVIKPKKFDPVKAEAARKALCGMCKTDGHNVERFLAEKEADRQLELEVEREREESRKTWRKQ